MSHTTDGKVCLYTCLMGDYEKLNDLPRHLLGAYPCICFTDDPDLTSETWEIRLVEAVFPMDCVRSQRHVKILAHEYLPEFDSSLYIDNSVQLMVPLAEVIEKCLDDSDISLLKHSFRDRVRDEFMAVATEGLDDSARIFEQLNHYLITQPDVLDGPVWWSAILFRHHQRPAVRSAMERWYNQVMRYSRRDQLSINVALQSLNVHVLELDNFESWFHRWPVVAQRRKDRRARDFSLSGMVSAIDQHQLVELGQQNIQSRLIRHHETVQQLATQLKSTRKEINRLTSEMKTRDEAQSSLSAELVDLRTKNIEQARCIAVQSSDMTKIINSRSWQMTSLLRSSACMAHRMTRASVRVKNALRYVVRGDWSRLRERIRSQLSENNATVRLPNRWGIMATTHTLFVAHLVAERLRQHGWSVDIMTESPRSFDHDMYIVVCPQMFERLPPGERRIAFQMEQSVSTRWFTAKYLMVLEQSLAVLDYSLANLDYLSKNGIVYPHVHYLPVGASPEFMPELTEALPDKQWDVLFYGDAKSSPRRRRLLDVLSHHFNVHVCDNLFGKEMARAIRSARVVINIHYYDNALLEMPRIQECLSLGTPVVSEAAQDQCDYPELSDAVTFFEQDNEVAMLAAVRSALVKSSSDAPRIAEAVRLGSQRFAFMFDRFLGAMKFIDSTQLASARLWLPDYADKIALSLPETIQRRRLFEANRPAGYAVFDGVRFQPGWIGCGLSYQSIATHALRNGMKRITVIEDDVQLPPDFDDKMRIVHSYLDSKNDQWDMFSGLMASLHVDLKVLAAEMYEGMLFVTVDRAMSMVGNVYNERMLRFLSCWRSDAGDAYTNTIDKYLEKQSDLRVVVALPFVVGHRNDVQSTLWGFQNSQYVEMIKTSEKYLMGLAEKHMNASGGIRDDLGGCVYPATPRLLTAS